MASINFPDNPTVGESLTVDSRTWIWDGTVWSTQIAARDFVRTVSDTSPANPKVGDEWFNSSTGRLYNFYDGYWIEIGASLTGEQGPAGTDGVASAALPLSYNPTTREISIDLSSYDTSSEVDAKIAAIVNSAPSTLDTLNELAAALGDDANFATTVTNAIADNATAIDAKQDIVENVSSTEIGYLDGATSNIQSQLNDRAISHNYIINGAFDIWQRGSGVALGADRWDGVTSSPITQSTDTPNGIGYSAVFNRTPSFQAQTKLESVNVQPLAGEVATLSFWAKASTSGSATISLRYPAGTDDWTLQSTFDTETISITTSWQRFSFTTTMDSLVSRGLQVNINSSALSGYDVYLAEVQLEAGSVATPFKRHAPSLQGELAACQRYYFKANASNVYATLSPVGLAVNTTVVGISYSIPVPMRVYPTSVEIATNIWLSDNVSNFTPSSVTLSGNGGNLSGVNVDVAVSSGLTQFRPYFIRAANDATAYIAFSAEL